MSFKTSVLIWFSRFRGTASPPTGVRLLCETEEHGFRQNDSKFAARNLKLLCL